MVTAIIQARLSSIRLQGKVLLPLGGKTVLEQVVERMRKATKVGKVVVATTIKSDDDEIAKLCEEKGIPCFRGDLNDVLDRYYQAAQFFQAKDVGRFTADCPLIDPELIDRVIDIYFKGGYDYVSTGRIVSTFPDGLDTEIFSFKSLEKAWKEAKLSSEREHVTPYIWKNPDKFKVFTVVNNIDQSSYRLTLDEEKDYILLTKIFQQVKELNTKNVLRFLDEHKDVLSINAQIGRDEGYHKSLREDKK